MGECLSPFLTSMKLFGLYFDRRPEGAADGNRRKWSPWMIYAVFALAFVWLNTARMYSTFTSADRFGLILLNKLVNVIWMTQCAISHTTFYATSHLGKVQDLFLKTKLSDECAVYLRRIAVVYTVASWSIMIMTATFFLYAIFFSGGAMDSLLTPLQTHIMATSIILFIPRIIVYVSSLYALSAHIFPQAMTFLMALLTSFQFKRVNAELDRCLDSQDGRVGEPEIETIRQQHQEISMSISRLDDCFMFSNASTFCCQLANVIILLYVLIFYHSCINDPVIVSAYIFWMVLMSVGLCFTAAGGILINYYVSEPSALVWYFYYIFLVIITV